MADYELAALCRHAIRLREDRVNWLSLWQDLATYFLPDRDDFLGERINGQEKMEELYISSPLLARRTLKTAVSTMLRPAGRMWFRANAKEYALNQVPEVRAWLELATHITYAALYDPRAQFEEKASEVDDDLVTFGTGCLHVTWSKKYRHLVFRSVSPRDLVIAENERGHIDKVFRWRSYTARQLEELFPDSLPDKIRDTLQGDNANPEKCFEVLHCVMPGREFQRWGGRSRFPFASAWLMPQDKHVLDASGGYYEQCYIVVRWDTTSGEVYGRSPAMIALKDARLANAIARTLLMAGEKAVDPPLIAPADMIRGDVELTPGGLTLYDASGFAYQGDPIRPIELGKNIPLTAELLEAVERRIDMAFYRDVLELPPRENSDRVTAYEIQARLDQYLRQAAPVFSRVESDYNAPLINRVFSILLREGMLPPPPPELEGEEIDFEYESPVKAARDKARALGMIDALNQVLPFAQVNPALLDNIDFDAVARASLRDLGFSELFFVNPEVMQRVREQRAQDEQMAKMAKMAQMAGPAIQHAAQGAATARESGLIDNAAFPVSAPAIPFDQVESALEDVEYEEVA